MLLHTVYLSSSVFTSILYAACLHCRNLIVDEYKTYITDENRSTKWLWNFFGRKGGRCLSHIIGSRVVQNAVFGGFTQFSIHFWPENAQKTTLKFFWPKGLKVFEPHYRVKGGPKCGFLGFYSVFYAFLTRKCPKNHFEFFLAEWVEGVWATL